MARPRTKPWWHYLRTRKLGKFWWIVGDQEFGPYGPYPSKSKCSKEKTALVRSMDNVDTPEYWTRKKTIL